MAYQGVSQHSRALKVCAAVLVVVALTGAQKSCQTSAQSGSTRAKVDSSAGSRADSTAESSVVVYSVTSDARIQSVTFLNSNGKKVTETDVGSTWSGSGPSDHGTVLVSATTSSGSTMIKCSVRVHGKVVQRASAVGNGSTTVVCRASY